MQVEKEMTRKNNELESKIKNMDLANSTISDMESVSRLAEDLAVKVTLSPSAETVLVYVDLETTHCSRLTSETIQIAATCGQNQYNAYIVPSKGISKSASNITGLTVKNGQMFYNDLLVNTIPPKTAWNDFLKFIQSQGDNVLLVAHNGYRFDFPIILREITRFKLLNQFSSAVKGLVDTLVVFREKLKDRLKKKLSFSQSSLASYYKIANLQAHNAMEDVRVLAELVNVIGITNENMNAGCKPVSWILENELRLENKRRNVLSMEFIKESVSANMIRKMAECGISLGTLQNVYRSNGEKGVCKLLSEDVGGKPRITKSKKCVEKIVKAVQTTFDEE